MLRCDSCGVVVTRPEDRNARQQSYYEQDYSLTQTVRASTEMHRYFRYPEYISLIGSVKKLIDVPARWLDIGCDHGFFLDDVRRHGYRVNGVEPSTIARQYATSIGLDVVPDIRDVQGPFNVVSMWHVLEHIPEPHQYLTIIRSRMASHGVLAIRVPDAQCFWSRVLRDKWIWFQPHHHCIQFNQGALKELLENSGFEIITMTRRKANTDFTKQAYALSTEVFADAGLLQRPSMRDKLARMYQDVTGGEIFVLARMLT